MTTPETSQPDDLREVLRGWMAEWSAMAAEHAFWRSDPEGTIVSFDGGAVTVSRGNERHEEELARLPDTQGLALAASRAGDGPFARDVVLRLSQSEVLRANVWLPSARAATLRQALHFELERLSPVDPGELYFDFAEVGRDKVTNRVELGLRIVRRAAVDETVRACHAAGLSAASIAFTGDARAADWQQFPVDKPAYYRLMWRKWNLAFLAGLALLLALATLMAWYARNAAAQDMLADQILAEQRRATIVHHIEDDIAHTNARIGFLAHQKQAPMAVSVLAELARIVPDGSWLDEVEIAGPRVHIRGYSHSAADLIGAIDRSPVFANAQFGAPVIRNPAGNVEQFDLVFDLKGAHK